MNEPGVREPFGAGTANARGEQATAIANKIRDNLGATWGLSESGAAGPSGSPYGDVPGRVCIAVSGTSAHVRTIETAQSDRAVNMELFARHVLSLFDEILSAHHNASRHKSL